MPNAALRFCSTPGCSARVPRGHCKAHRQAQERIRGTRQERGYTDQWVRYSRHRLAQHPWCVGYPTPHEVATLATVTDHRLNAKDHPELFWAEANHQSLCATCHARKTIDEDGGFGR